MFFFPLLAITNHVPPVLYESFAKQKAGVSKKQLLALRCTVDSGSEELPLDSILALLLGDMDNCCGRVSAMAAHFAQIQHHYCSGVSRLQKQELAGGLSHEASGVCHLSFLRPDMKQRVE